MTAKTTIDSQANGTNQFRFQTPAACHPPAEEAGPLTSTTSSPQHIATRGLSPTEKTPVAPDGHELSPASSH